MFESIIIQLIRQAALLTKPQQDEITTKGAEILGTIVTATETEIDETLVRALLPMAGDFVTKLGAELG